MEAQRDKRMTDTRQRIIKAAAKLYSAGGYERINLQEIANGLGMSKAALFYHFKNKQELFFATLMDLLERFHSMVQEAVDQAPLNVQEQLKRIMHRLTQQPIIDVTRYLHEEAQYLSPQQELEVERAVDEHLFRLVRAVFIEGISRGELRDHDAHLSSMLFLNICLSLSYPESPLRYSIPHERLEDYSNQVIHMFVYGLIAPSAGHMPYG